MYQFLNDKKFFVINVNKLWIVLQKYPGTILITYTKMVPTLCSIQLYEDQQQKLVNNYCTILILSNFQKTKSPLITLTIHVGERGNYFLLYFHLLYFTQK